MLWKQQLTRTEQKWLKMEGIKTGQDELREFYVLQRLELVTDAHASQEVATNAFMAANVVKNSFPNIVPRKCSFVFVCVVSETLNKSSDQRNRKTTSNVNFLSQDRFGRQKVLLLNNQNCHSILGTKYTLITRVPSFLIVQLQA